MKTWQIAVGISVFLFIIAPIIGVIIGRQAAKKKHSATTDLLSTKQRIVFFASLVVGAALITTGLLLPKQEPTPLTAQEGQQEGQTDEFEQNDSMVGTEESAKYGGGTGQTIETFEFSTQNGGGAVILD